MEDHTMLVALISALGIKEIWNIWKKKLDLNAKKDEREDEVFINQIQALTDKISGLEVKIQTLIEENTQLLVKVARLKHRRTEDCYIDIAGYAAIAGEIQDTVGWKEDEDEGTRKGRETAEYIKSKNV